MSFLGAVISWQLSFGKRPSHPTVLPSTSPICTITCWYMQSTKIHFKETCFQGQQKQTRVTRILTTIREDRGHQATCRLETITVSEHTRSFRRQVMLSR